MMANDLKWMLRSRNAGALARGAVALALVVCATSAAAVEYKLGFVNTERLFREATPAK